MDVEIRALRGKDFGKAISFAITGMHFERYTDVPVELRIYGRYFLYMEMERATQILAAYLGDALVGILMADMKGEPKTSPSFWRGLFVRCMKAILRIAYRSGTDAYDAANAQMLRRYREGAEPDGEICFLAADPALQGKGIGSALLQAFEDRASGKRVFLFTDSNCTYPFYERRGFVRALEEDVIIEIHGRAMPLTCFLYDKAIP